MTDPQIKEAIESNPCGKCRATGMPSCKCKSGGGGDGPENESENDVLESQNNIINNATQLVLKLSDSELWDEKIDKEEAFQYLNPHSLIDLTLDVHNCKLTFNIKEDLSPTERQKVAELYEAIKEELADFKSEMAAEGKDVSQIQVKDIDGKLEIKIPNPELYTAFVSRLMQGNLIPTQMPTVDNIQSKNYESNPETEVNKSASAPNPFDISGPTPFDGGSGE